MISSILTSLLALAPAAAAAPESFGLVTIHSGSQYQYASIKVAENGHFTVAGDDDQAAVFSLTGDGNLQTGGNNVSVTNSQPLVSPWWSNHFSIKDGHLTWLDSDSWYVCDNQEVFYGRFGVPDGCSNPVGVALHTV